MSQSKCVAYPPYTGDKRLVLEGLIHELSSSFQAGNCVSIDIYMEHVSYSYSKLVVVVVSGRPIDRSILVV